MAGGLLNADLTKRSEWSVIDNIDLSISKVALRFLRGPADWSEPSPLHVHFKKI